MFVFFSFIFVIGPHKLTGDLVVPCMVSMRIPLPSVCFVPLSWFDRQLPALSLTLKVPPTSVIALKQRKTNTSNSVHN